VLFIAAVVLWALGVIGDLLAAQRVMTQRTFERMRRVELQLGVAPSHYERGDRRLSAGEQRALAAQETAPASASPDGEAGSPPAERPGEAVRL
jgi:hypothetical protein